MFDVRKDVVMGAPGKFDLIEGAVIVGVATPTAFTDSFNVARLFALGAAAGVARSGECVLATSPE